jgi:hypothetical protein
VLEQKQLENQRIYCIGGAEFPLRFTHCAPLLSMEVPLGTFSLMSSKALSCLRVLKAFEKSVLRHTILELVGLERNLRTLWMVPTPTWLGQNKSAHSVLNFPILIFAETLQRVIPTAIGCTPLLRRCPPLTVQ